MVTLELQNGTYVATINGEDVAVVTLVGVPSVQVMLSDVLASIRAMAAERVATRVTTAYTQLDAATKAEVDRLLGFRLTD